MDAFIFENGSHGVRFPLGGVGLTEHHKVVFPKKFEHPVPPFLVLLRTTGTKALGIPDGPFVVALVSHIHELLGASIIILSLGPLPFADPAGLFTRGVSRVPRRGGSGMIPSLPAFVAVPSIPHLPGMVICHETATGVAGGCGSRILRRIEPITPSLARLVNWSGHLLIGAWCGGGRLQMSNFVWREIRVAATKLPLSSRMSSIVVRNMRIVVINCVLCLENIRIIVMSVLRIPLQI